MSKPKAYMAWSTGKESAWALREVRQAAEVEVVALLSTVTDPYERVSMHGVREELLRMQADAVGCELRVVRIPARCTNEVYEEKMHACMTEAKADGVSEVVFGDVFLEDVRAHREKNLARIGMSARFPLWGRDTRRLAREMIAGGLRAYVTCLDPKLVPPELAGHAFDEELLSALPGGADPCAEHGEFHTFVWDCPGFGEPIEVELGETVERAGLVFVDILPRGRPGSRPVATDERG